MDDEPTDRLPVLSCAGTCAPPAAHPVEGGWHRLAAADAIPSGEMKAFLVGGVGVLVARLTDDEYVAFQALCPHELVPLDQGLVQGSTLTCLEHMWQWNLRSGAPLGEAEEALRRYPLKQEDGSLFVAL
jgi:toluene monooxygenase system ferredoxin subunit